MPVPHLFCAEVDSIQNTVFRASGQRQVVGGSSLLAELDQRASQLAVERYGVYPDDVIKHGGGSFLIVFPDREPAVAFGQDLADLYRSLLDASITVTDPLPLPDGRDAPNFKDVQKQINLDLRRMKRENRGPAEVAHAPTTAFCQSSGTGLAEYFEIPSAIAAGSPQYLSGYARLAGQVGAQVKKADGLLHRLYAFLPKIYQDLELANTVDDISALDEARGNVAYLLADGNNMGKYFNKCNAQQMKDLAKALDEAVSRAVTAPLEELTERLGLDAGPEPFLPVLPLILAGDDVFLLTPAFYALDYARRFCLKFEEVMSQTLVVQTLCKEYQLPNPTVAAAVVICKGSYPYHLAHQRGENLLENAKRMIKTKCAGQLVWHSAVAFDMIAGSELVSGQMAKKKCLSTLSPYWVIGGKEKEKTADAPLESPFREASIELSRLLAARYTLRDMPQKRLVEVERLYTPEMLPQGLKDIQDTQWMKALQRLQERMNAGEQELPTGPTGWDIFQSVLSYLGDEQKPKGTFETGHWRDIKRLNPDQGEDELFYANGIADLLRVWQYAQDLTHRPSDYQGKEER